MAQSCNRRVPGSGVRIRRPLLICVLLCSILCSSHGADAWDSGTHRAITRLAVEALPPSPLKTTLARNEVALERFSVEPDSVLKRKYGKAEERRHYINLEWFGSDPFAALDPDINAMRKRFGARILNESGTLPWSIAQTSDAVESSWRSGECERALRMSGYLSHYVADASQPLHSTIHYDGYRRDRGVHSRLEGAVDHSLDVLLPLARQQVKVEPVNGAWTPAIAEIRDANALVGEVIREDRAARDRGAYGGGEYADAVVRADGATLARQLARAASVLGSIWLYDWDRAGKPDSCETFYVRGEQWTR